MLSLQLLVQLYAFLLMTTKTRTQERHHQTQHEHIADEESWTLRAPSTTPAAVLEGPNVCSKQET